jgi:hypothetical protein
MKIRCKECNWEGVLEQVLEAKHPFQDQVLIYGCPKCLEAEPFETLCDEPGCRDIYSCGTPSPSGYRQTCHKHIPIVSHSVEGRQ